MLQSKWGFSNIPDLTAKVCIVTGGNSGLGYETVKAFALKGAEVVMACRSLDKGAVARQKIIQNIPEAKIHVYKLDLADLKSVESFAEQFKQKFDRLDILVNNAGIMMVPYNVTADGFESQLGTNHLGHFALTGRLLALIQKTPKCRVVNVSSLAHKQGKFDFDDLNYTNGKNYHRIRAYSRSKLANLLFTRELQKYFETKGIEAVAVSAHPGVSNTNLASHLEKNILFKIMKPLFYWFSQGADMGALPQIRAAVDLSVIGEEFFGPGGKRQMKGYPVLVQPQNSELTSENASKLWEVSSKITDVNYYL